MPWVAEELLDSWQVRLEAKSLSSGERAELSVSSKTSSRYLLFVITNSILKSQLPCNIR